MTSQDEGYCPQQPLAVSSSLSPLGTRATEAPPETCPGKTTCTASSTRNGGDGRFPATATRFTWCQRAHPVEVFQLGRRTVTEPLHGLDWRVAEVRGFSIHHLYHHDPQRPDIHLWAPRSHQCRQPRAAGPCFIAVTGYSPPPATKGAEKHKPAGCHWAPLAVQHGQRTEPCWCCTT